ncbi:hypothetical protein HNQ59_003714 [Chitinivorax tropicus]|uniref:Proline-rich protein n=1 Tax=Chitinivorax tropicus TaxID=714531 RepID=A0A840MSK4_9PROT|nr:hypothetical protein [Chitinivorax tropicus]MBB5020395.1 hypothetical protein [Chitinivorax tropicus]
MSNAILIKTDAGQEAVLDRSLYPNLNGRLRTLLLQIDGKKRASELMQLALSLGAPADSLDKLLAMGLIVRETPPTPRIVMPTIRTGTPPPAPAPIPARVERREVPVAVEPSTPAGFERFQEAAQMMSEAAAKHLGLKAMFFTLKVDRCSNARELRGLMEDFRKAIAKAKTPFFADRLTEEIEALLD